jgi:hypothetical protein
LQGTSEKIYFQSFFRQQLLGLPQLLLQSNLGRWRCTPALVSTALWLRIGFLLPAIQLGEMHVQLSGQGSDVLSIAHPLNCFLPECR